MVIITSIKDSSATYEKREYVYGKYLWCLVRGGEVIRWLDTFEVDKIESVIKFMEAKQ